MTNAPKALPSSKFEDGPREVSFRMPDGLYVRGDEWGDPADPPVLFAHGGGQTRHAWGKAASVLAGEGWRAIAVDARGHGESDWSEAGDYDLERFAADLREIASQLGTPPALVGASLGGLSALIAQGEAEHPVFSAIVLVDITPETDPAGVDRIRGFMAANADEGFASLDEAADAISAYLPHRKRPKDHSGLAKNLRLRPDGRYRWHWDPKFLHRAPNSTARSPERLNEATRNVRVPLLLVRGRASEVVGEQQVKAFLDAAPHAEYVDVSDAGHMVAGDRNDAFNEAVIGFLRRLRTKGPLENRL